VISVRWKKVFRDLTSNRSRTALVVLSIAVGIFATGAILGARQVLLREFARDYAASDRASIDMRTSDVGQSVVDKVKKRTDVVRATGRRIVTGRIRQSPANADAVADTGEWETLEVDALSDFNSKPGRILNTDSSHWPPKRGEIVIEGGATAVYSYKVGDTVEVETRSGTAKLRIAGFAHDLNSIPSRFYRQVTGYVSMDTLTSLSEPEEFNDILIDVDSSLKRVEAARIGAKIRDEVMLPAGITVERMSVPIPGSHFFGDIFKAVSVLLLAMALMALALSGFLVVTTTSAILVQQTRQLGIMKAIGGRRWQIARMYVGLVFMYGVLGVAVGTPFGVLFGHKFIQYAANVLNFHVYDGSYPTWVMVVLVGIGTLVPVLAAAVPIIAGVKRPIVEAFNPDALWDNYGHGLIDRLLARIHGLPRPTALALRSTFAHKGRLALTLATLILASAVVMAVFSARASLMQSVDNVGSWWNYDAMLSLSTAAPQSSLETAAKKVDGVTYAETWLDGRTVIDRPDGSANESYFTLGVPADTKVLDFQYSLGRALEPGEKGVVLNTELFNDEPYLTPGSTVYIEVNGVVLKRTVVGIATGSLMGPYMFMDRDDLAKAMGVEGSATRVVVKAGSGVVAATQSRMGKDLERRLDRSGFATSSVQTQVKQLDTTKGQLGILVTFLIIMASALALVGVIGLSGSMTLTVIESTREIGVMRSIGASHKSIFGIFITQGLVVGTLAWFGGALVSYPLSWWLMKALESALGMPLAYRYSWSGVVVWLVAVWIISVLGSLLPAWRASLVSVRDAIAYE